MLDCVSMAVTQLLQAISNKKALEQEVTEGWLPKGIFP